MRCRIDNVWLCDGTTAGGKGLGDLDILPSYTDQVTPGVRSSAPFMQDRNNVYLTVTFSCARTHSSLRACELYLLDHTALVPASGVAEIFTTDNGGARYIYAHLVRITQLKQRGVTSYHGYRIVGPEILVQKPSG